LTATVRDAALTAAPRAPRREVPRVARDYATAAAQRRMAFLREATGASPEHLGRYSFDSSVLAGNIENFVGVAQVPIGVAGPLLVDGEHARGAFYVPLATTEGTLVASYNRGMKLLYAAGGVRTTVVADAMQRAGLGRGRLDEPAVKPRHHHHDLAPARNSGAVRCGPLRHRDHEIAQAARNLTASADDRTPPAVRGSSLRPSKLMAGRKTLSAGWCRRANSGLEVPPGGDFWRCPRQPAGVMLKPVLVAADVPVPKGRTIVTSVEARPCDPALRARGAVAPAVEVSSLCKRYGEVEAVRDVSFSVQRGEVFAFLGPNGAGKTTTVKVLCTLARRTSGRASVAGFDVTRQPRTVRRRIGLVFQEQTLDDRLTAEQNLRFHAVLYHVPHGQVEQRIGRVLRLVALEDRRHDLVSTFSGGMARRLEIARGMLHTPAVLFLDEPTVGLDPQTRALVWEDVLRLRREEQATVFLTTHYMDEAEYADRIAIIDHGSIVATGAPDELKRHVGADSIELVTADNAAAAKHVAAAGFRVRAGDGQVVVFAEDGEAQVPRLIEAAGVRVRSVHVHRPTLDDVFLHYTGRQIRDEHAEQMMPMRLRARVARR
jgi:ABC-2 type transport system ATP-binding protein